MGHDVGLHARAAADLYRAAWQRVRDDPIPWIVCAGAFTALGSLTGGFCLVLMPNLIRAFDRALQQHEAPRFQALWDFDSVADDLLPMLIWLIACTLGSVLVVAVIVPIVLLLWVPSLTAERSFGGLDAVRASFAHARDNWMPIGLFVLVGVAVNAAGLLLLCVGVLISVPVTYAALCLYFAQQREAIIAAAADDGVRPI